MTGFWRSWLNIWCWAVGLFGVALLSGGFAATSPPLAGLYGLLGNVPPPDFDPPLRFSAALLGAITIGWAITLQAAIRAAVLLGSPIWRHLTVAVIVWYVLDSALSVWTGFGLNAVPNTVFLVTYLVPVWRSGAWHAAPVRG